MYLPVHKTVVSKEARAGTIRDTIGQVIHKQEEEQRAQHCALGDTGKYTVFPGMHAFDHDTLGAVFEKGPDPVRLDQ